MQPEFGNMFETNIHGSSEEFLKGGQIDPSSKHHHIHGYCAPLELRLSTDSDVELSDLATSDSTLEYASDDSTTAEAERENLLWCERQIQERLIKALHSPIGHSPHHDVPPIPNLEQVHTLVLPSQQLKKTFHSSNMQLVMS